MPSKMLYKLCRSSQLLNAFSHVRALALVNIQTAALPRTGGARRGGDKNNNSLGVGAQSCSAMPYGMGGSRSDIAGSGTVAGNAKRAQRRLATEIMAELLAARCWHRRKQRV